MICPPHRLEGALGNRSPGGQGLEAAAIATGAEGSLGLKRHMPDFPSVAMCAAVEASANDNSSSDTGANGHIHYVFQFACRAHPDLAERGTVCIVFNLNQHGQPLLQKS